MKEQIHTVAQANLQLAEQMEEDECSESRTSTTSTEMSVVETHSVALKYNGEKVEAEKIGTKIKGYRLETLKWFLKKATSEAT